MDLSLAGPALALLSLSEVFAFGLFWFDKVQARNHSRRIRESTLLQVALIGGVGAWAGQQLLRHKTRKEPFRTWLSLIVVLHLALVAGGAWLIVSP